jgi:hypothetical protein
MTHYAHERFSLPTSTATRGVVLTQRLQRVIRGCVAAALGRFAAKVRHVFVWIEDTNGPREGSGLRCRIELRLKRGGCLNASSEALNEYAAVGRAAKRARVLLIRNRQKKRAPRRQRAIAANPLSTTAFSTASSSHHGAPR